MNAEINNVKSFSETELDNSCSNNINDRRNDNYISIDNNSKRMFNKVLIPYDFEKKIYLLKKSDIELYKNKKYIIETLVKFNCDPLFNIDNHYVVESNFKKIILYLPSVIIGCLLIYIAIYLSLVIFLNPGLILVMIYLIYKILKRFEMMIFVIYEKMKMSKIQKLLNLENNSDFCKNEKLSWALGLSGYWIELIKY